MSASTQDLKAWAASIWPAGTFLGDVAREDDAATEGQARMVLLVAFEGFKAALGDGVNTVR